MASTQAGRAGITIGIALHDVPGIRGAGRLPCGKHVELNRGVHLSESKALTSRGLRRSGQVAHPETCHHAIGVSSRGGPIIGGVGTHGDDEVPLAHDITKDVICINLQPIPLGMRPLQRSHSSASATAISDS